MLSSLTWYLFELRWLPTQRGQDIHPVAQPCGDCRAYDANHTEMLIGFVLLVHSNYVVIIEVLFGLGMRCCVDNGIPKCADAFIRDLDLIAWFNEPRIRRTAKRNNIIWQKRNPF